MYTLMYNTDVYVYNIIALFLFFFLFFQSCTIITSPKAEEEAVGGLNTASRVFYNNDGIPDDREVSGQTYLGLPLYDYGARSNQIDLFVHVLYMDNPSIEALKPQRKALEMVRDAFAAKGIGVHFDVGNLFHNASGISPQDFDLSDGDHRVPYTRSITFSSIANGHAATVEEYYLSYMPSNRRPLFYCMVFGSSASSTGRSGPLGIAYISGVLSLITLGHISTLSGNLFTGDVAINVQAGVIMHEFGHNLGLLHGGNENQNAKPNYYSIMNYIYTLGLPTIGNNDFEHYFKYFNYPGYTANTIANTYTSSPNQFKIDFSDGAGTSIDESNFNEANGLLGRLGSSPADVNRNFLIDTSIINDINDNGITNVLNDHDDWGNLKFFFGSSNGGTSSGISLDNTLSHDCLSEDCGVFHAHIR